VDVSEIVLFLTGDEIGTFTSLSSKGNSNGVQVSLSGVEPLGTIHDVFKLVITQTNGGTEFANGQFVAVYSYPESDPPEPPLYSGLNPQHDQFQGRASSAEHQIFTNPAKIVIDLNGVTAGDMQFGPGSDPPRGEKLPFENLSEEQLKDLIYKLKNREL